MIAAGGAVHDAETGEPLGVARGSEYDGRMVEVVLTIAHLDHQPENNGVAGDRPNLAALCQRCHNRHDGPARAAGRRKRARAKMAVGDLLASETLPTD